VPRLCSSEPRGQKLVADHEFLHRRGSQQRRIVVRVEMPFRMRLAVRNGTFTVLNSRNNYQKTYSK
jgi:hypothetical protein